MLSLPVLLKLLAPGGCRGHWSWHFQMDLCPWYVWASFELFYFVCCFFNDPGPSSNYRISCDHTVVLVAACWFGWMVQAHVGLRDSGLLRRDEWWGTESYMTSGGTWLFELPHYHAHQMCQVSELIIQWLTWFGDFFRWLFWYKLGSEEGKLFWELWWTTIIDERKRS